MEWDDLKHFLAVARVGSLTEAARLLKASPATVGRHIDSLEQRLGTRLFDRRQTGYTLTDGGEAIRTKAEEVEEGILSIEREVLGRDREASGRVRVATTDDLASFIVAPHLNKLREAFPGIALEVVARNDLANLTRRDADIAFRTRRPEQGDLLIRRIGSVELGLYASKSYVDARAIVPDGIDLSKLDIITWVEEWANLRGGPWLAQHAPGAAIALQTNSTRVMFAACKAGVGAAILPCFVGDAEVDLVCLVPPDRMQSIDIWLVVHRDVARTARVRVVMDFLAELGPTMSRHRRSGESEPSVGSGAAAS